MEEAGDGPVLLLPDGVDIEYLPSDNVRTQGLGSADSKQKELVTIVTVEDPLLASFGPLDVIAPRTYVDGLPDPPCHVVAQALMYFRWDDQTAAMVDETQRTYEYGVCDRDVLWRSTAPPREVTAGTACLVMNRRVGGWDGSPDRPVVELLAGGGHVKTIWDDAQQRFGMMSIEDTLLAELQEELGYRPPDDALHRIGGFVNQLTKELVVLAALEVAAADIPAIQAAAYGNVDENIDGLYLAPFDEVMLDYLQDGSTYAGGEAAKVSNFPSDPNLRPLIAKRLHQAP